MSAVKPFWYEYETSVPDSDPTAVGLKEGWSETVSARTIAALAFKRRQGKRISGRTPYGYRVEGSDLVEVPAEQEVIHLMVELQKAGLSLRAIGAQLKAKGCKRQNGSADWPSNIVLMILRRARKLATVEPQP